MAEPEKVDDGLCEVCKMRKEVFLRPNGAICAACHERLTAGCGLDVLESAVEPQDVFYEKKEYVTTKMGNKIGRKSVLCGVDKIMVKGKSIVEPRVVVRGDLARVELGKFVVVCEGAVIRPPGSLFKGQRQVYMPMVVGNHCVIGPDSVVQAATIGSFCFIGKGCVIVRLAEPSMHSLWRQGERCRLMGCVKVLDNTVIAADSFLPPFTVYGGSPGRIVGTVPESFVDTMVDHTSSYYKHFLPRTRTVITAK